MRLLELFSGTRSVGKVAERLGYDVVSLDLKNADINVNILEWDYKVFPAGMFDVVWASPPCTGNTCSICCLARKRNAAAVDLLIKNKVFYWFVVAVHRIQNPSQEK